MRVTNNNSNNIPSGLVGLFYGEGVLQTRVDTENLIWVGKYEPKYNVNKSSDRMEKLSDPWDVPHRSTNKRYEV